MAEAAKRLGYDRSTLQARLKEKGWKPQYRLVRGRRARVIEDAQMVAIGREDTIRVVEQREEAGFTLRGVCGGAMDTVHVFALPGIAPTGKEKVFDLNVPLLTLWRYAYKHHADTEGLRNEIRLALSKTEPFAAAGCPESFGVRFQVDENALFHDLAEIIGRVRVPDGLDPQEVQLDANVYLRGTAVYRLRNVRGDPSHYLARAVTFFYRNRLRAERSRLKREMKHAAEVVRYEPEEQKTPEERAILKERTSTSS